MHGTPPQHQKQHKWTFRQRKPTPKHSRKEHPTRLVSPQGPKPLSDLRKKRRASFFLPKKDPGGGKKKKNTSPHGKAREFLAGPGPLECQIDTPPSPPLRSRVSPHRTGPSVLFDQKLNGFPQDCSSLLNIKPPNWQPTGDLETDPKGNSFLAYK